jgi:hypothetical protein
MYALKATGERLLKNSVKVQMPAVRLPHRP